MGASNTFHCYTLNAHFLGLTSIEEALQQYVKFKWCDTSTTPCSHLLKVLLLAVTCLLEATVNITIQYATSSVRSGKFFLIEAMTQ